MLVAQLVDRPAPDFVRAVTSDKIVQPGGAGDTDTPRQLATGPCDRNQAPAVDQVLVIVRLVYSLEFTSPLR